MPMAVRMTDPITREMFSFHPDRCVERFYPRMVEQAIKGFMANAWEPWYMDYLKDHKVDEETLLKTLRAFSVFVDLSLDPEIETVRDAIATSGFFDYPLAAQQVVMFKIGQLCAGTFWAGVRHSVMVGVVPEPVQMLNNASAELSKYIDERWNTHAAQGAECPAQPPASAGPSTAPPPA